VHNNNVIFSLSQSFNFVRKKEHAATINIDNTQMTTYCARSRIFFKIPNDTKVNLMHSRGTY